MHLREHSAQIKEANFEIRQANDATKIQNPMNKSSKTNIVA